ncbi:MAG TPA: hypothetical protein VI911_07770 [Patescibacteria group bacterium]|nr:hypothetical protein [Patescibacteria group bacterium]
MKNSKKKQNRLYWYLFHHAVCPVCGDEDHWKERIYDRPKPKSVVKRHNYSYMSCYCMY